MYFHHYMSLFFVKLN